MTYFILGISSFIAKNYYLYLRKKGEKIICLHHDNLERLYVATSEDVVINCCGVNRADSRDAYEEGNHLFLHRLYDNLNKDSLPFLLHVSSYMVNGFEDQGTLPDYQKFFIEAKLNGERYLQEHYPSEKLCIVRPTNIYGYNCEPYYNNLLVTIVHEKIVGTYKITKINSNTERNFLSIEGLISQIVGLVSEKRTGIFNLMSNQTINLETLVKTLYGNTVPEQLKILAGDQSIAKRIPINGEILQFTENLKDTLMELERQMRAILLLKDLVSVTKRDRLSQPRGDMIEISSLESKRLYMITLNDHSVRGNHYHHEQIEDFYVHKGILVFLLAHKDDQKTVQIITAKSGDRITVKPPIIHTLVNDFIGQIPEIFITSSYPYIANAVPDTVYINLV